MKNEAFMDPLLTIAIPTFNRVHLLRQTVEILLPQLRDGVELLVCDNCSTDGTAVYLQSLAPKLRHHRHPKNMGSDPNFLSCLSLSRSQYTWILCDDDFPGSNAVEEILRARAEFREPGLIYLRVKTTDERLSDYDPAPVQTGWAAKDRDQFLEDIGVWVTFGSSIIVRRDVLDMEFLKGQYGTNLLSASITLQAAGVSNSIVVSEKPLLFVRGGNAGGYSAYTVFTKNFSRLLGHCRQFGYAQKALDSAYRSALTQVIGNIIEIWPLTAAGFFDVCRSSWNYSELYQKLLPAFARKARRQLGQLPHRLCWRAARRVVRSFGERFGAELYPLAQETLDKAARKYFRAQAAGAHPNANVRHPVHLMNPQYFQIGSNFNAQPGLRMEAWDVFCGEHFYPVIKIGNNVSLNWNVHIGAINRIEIHDNVLIGSHVLITDHVHGAVDARDLAAAPAQRPLSSKGPVVIERDVWIGEGVCILAGVTIGEGAIIGANAVVTANVPPRSVVGGVPARVIRQVAEDPVVDILKREALR